MEYSIAKNLIHKLKILIFTIIEKYQGVVLSDDGFYQKPIVVLLKPLGIGDLIMLSPLFSLLKTRYPEITVVSDYDNFSEFDDLDWYSVDEFVRSQEDGFYLFPMHCFSNLKLMRKKKLPFVGYFLTNNFNRNKPVFNGAHDHYFLKAIESLRYLGLNVDGDFDYPKIKTTPYNIPENYICISPYSNWDTRTTPIQNFISFLEKIGVSGKEMLIVGGPNSDEKEYNSKICKIMNSKGFNVTDLTGKTTFKELSYIIKNAYIFMGNDSGPSHIASVMCQRSVIFDGCVPASLRIPLNETLQEKITYFDGAFRCPSYPCYDGFNKPLCIDAQKYNCMKSSIPLTKVL